jgi:ornithine cyclodeaminase/alanine dehydrogenase-like protein (mu-crystallin family)
MSEPNTITFFSASDVAANLTMPAAIDAMRDAFIALSGDRATIPPRLHLDAPVVQGMNLVMPVYAPEIDLIGLKFVSVYPLNPKKNKPTIHALMSVYKGSTGEPLAVIEAEKLTAIRTGAVGGLAADLFTPGNADTAAIFGAGHQGITQLMALCEVRKIKYVKLVDPSEAKRNAFTGHFPAITFIEFDESPPKIEADIICTTSTSTTPLFTLAQIRPETHINAIGAFKPDHREIGSDVIANAAVIVDSMQPGLEEAGEIVIPMAEGTIDASHIKGEIGNFCNGELNPQPLRKQLTVFKSLGNAIQDLYAARIVLENARAKGHGTKLKL